MSLVHAKRKADVRMFPYDLSKPDDVASLCSELASLPVAILVNNASFGYVGSFLEQPCDNINEQLEVNLRAYTALMHAFTQRMVRAGKGRVLNVASVASIYPGPNHAVYYAAKAFVLSLSEALHFELRSTGVAVTALCPGPIDTEFFDAARAQGTLYASGPKQEPNFVAAMGVRAMFKGEQVAIPGMSMKLMIHLQMLAPRLLKVWLQNTGWSKV